MEYYSAIKKNKIMPFAVTRKDLEIIILSERWHHRSGFRWLTSGTHVYVPHFDFWFCSGPKGACDNSNRS